MTGRSVLQRTNLEVLGSTIDAAHEAAPIVVGVEVPGSLSFNTVIVSFSERIAITDPDVNFALDLNLDSFAWMELAVALEAAIGVHLTEADIAAARLTVDEIAMDDRIRSIHR